MKKLLLGCVVASSLAIPNLAFAANSSESIETSTDNEATIPAYMAPGTVIKFNEQEESVVLREGDKKASLPQSRLYEDESDLPVIKPGMTVVYDALGAPIVVVPESRESINVEMKEINPVQEIPRAAKTESGKVSWYDIWAESNTASGEKADDGAAHKTIAFKTSVSVKSNDNSKTTTVRILDRGPYVKGRILDMSKQTFGKLHPISKGVFNGTISWNG
ncbi:MULTISPECIES: septal ring lytic transglycosylase RlpA family protein [unclassified Lysinibacillus]|uniref:septal ring lytic transglycosylase RlpA family protein n=1 Tax=unclassified Lysinibacillus TaxID=2636778 RepID=UPI002553E953|nr:MULTISPECIES: septal ring lytic transglycosylase RlpA family protein [unclassified Lysinibacillus]MDM5248343.1 septal ring lytic transglycosylase RlpA family protein [Lysinibacillus sp. G4S2]